MVVVASSVSKLPDAGCHDRLFKMKCDYCLVAGLHDCIEMHKQGMSLMCIHVCSLLYIICAMLFILL